MGECVVCDAIYGGGDISKEMAKKFGTCEKVRVESSNILEQEIMK